MSKQAWIYVGAVLALGAYCALSALAVPIPSATDWQSVLVLIFLATLAQSFKAEAPTHQLYYVTKVFQYAAVLLLHPALFVLLIVVSHTAEWAKERLAGSNYLRAWYLQPFNVSTHLIAGGAARLWIQHGLGDVPLTIDYSTPMVITVLVGALIYLALNHAIVGVALSLARGISLRDSGILDFENLLTDYVLLLIGYVFALAWVMNPWLSIPALAPIALIFRALMVPKLTREARIDAKTGLWNAQHFTEMANAEIERAQRSGEGLAILMVDLDLLRNINNTYGHLAGDAVLAGIGRAIRETIRGADMAGRFGGEEFSILLSNVTTAQARSIAERLRALVAATPFESQTTSGPIRATLSVGIAHLPDDGEDLETLVHAADIAVYQAKVQGRNRVVASSEVPHSFTLETAGLEHSQPEPPAPKRFLSNGTGPTTEPPAPAVQPPPPPPAQAVATPTGAAKRESLIGELYKEKRRAGSQEDGLDRWSRPMWLFFSAVVFGAYAIGLSGLGDLSTFDPMLVLLFASLALLAELFGISLYEEASLSVSMALNFAMAMTGSVLGVAIVSLAIALGPALIKRPAPYKVLFNGATHLLAGLGAMAVFRPLGLELDFASIPTLILPSIAALMIYFLIETWLVATAMGLSTRQRIGRIWRTQFQWLASHYLVEGLIGMLLIVATLEHGAVGILVFGAPLVVIRRTQQQYVERTEHSVLELQRMNRELNAANLEIRAASTSIQKLNDDLFLTLAKIIDARDPFVSGHAAQVADYAMAIGAELGLSGRALERLGQAGLLHDIGKIGISEQILHKPGRLTPEEYEQVKSHADIGGDLLETSQSLCELAPFVRHHHERWDGDGYPAGLKGEEIPLEARILSVCDAVETMASDRPYKRARSADEILEEVRRCSGGQFDPTVASAFLRIVEREGIQFVVNSAQAVALRQQERRAVTPLYEWMSL